ncbi:ATP-binding protein [Streptomyces montanisoli]|uniref:Regulator n=1 Tax=Streptomyces montanisoli TaxID=2798581 RepID=A0A940RXV0_9ACTN|nr:AAA family ATPase [Streptomyces montanisoli]MBP0458513.1 regulator [Streptomyces montanisoli]
MHGTSGADTGHGAPGRTRPGNLPAELSTFVGRGGELADLVGLLESGQERLLTVVGVGGVGKTRLALRAAAAAARSDRGQKRYCDGVWLVELAALRDGDLVDHAFADALGLTDQSPRATRDVLGEFLAEREALLVVDGFEQLADACAAAVRDLLRRAPGLRVLATGRRPLGVEGERTVGLAPLPPEQARELFVARGAARVPGFRPSGADDHAITEVCARLDGIPLALELAAGRLPALSPGQLLARLDDRFALLKDGGRGALPRHRTLRTAIGWSHELCTPRERLLWARLSVFPGPFDLDAAEYVCGGPDLPADEVLDLLGALIDQSLVIRDATPAGVRYRMLATVRAYGAQWLEEVGDADRLRRLHRDWYVGLATWYELDWYGPRQEEVAAGTESAMPNLRAALDLCLATPEEAHIGQHLAGTLWFYWAGCGRLAEGRHWLDRALSWESTRNDGARLKALWVQGYVSLLQGDTTAAVGALHECRRESLRTGDELAYAYAVHRMGCLALLTDDMPRAEHLLVAALRAYRELGEVNSNVLMAQAELAMALAFQGDLDRAVAECVLLREACEDSGERWARAYALYVLAYAEWEHGRHREARGLLAECLTINHAFHDLVGLVLAMELAALVSASEGDAAEAAVLHGAASRLWDSVGLPLFGSRFFGAPQALCERRSREELGASRYAACVERGRRLPAAEAVARALRGPGGQAREGDAAADSVRGEPAAARES